MSYDALPIREFYARTVAGNGTVGGRFQSFQKARLKAVHAQAVTAGTTAGHTLTVKIGATAVATLTLSTSTALTKVSVTGLAAAIPQMADSVNTIVSVTNGTDATGVADVVYEYVIENDATISAG